MRISGPIMIVAALTAVEAAALTAEERADLLDGRGMGYATPADMNGYPGPRHLLDNAEALALTPQEILAITGIFERMQAEARRLGAELVASEDDLVAAFGRMPPTSDEIDRLTAQAAAIEAELRALHLNAHLETRPLLSEAQIALYGRLRHQDRSHSHE